MYALNWRKLLRDGWQLTRHVANALEKKNTTPSFMDNHEFPIGLHVEIFIQKFLAQQPHNSSALKANTFSVNKSRSANEYCKAERADIRSMRLV